MATYATMQARIADELDRSDLTSQIQNAIQDAIGFYERRYFYFTSNPQAGTFNTVNGQEYYSSTALALIATAPEIYELTGTFTGLRRQLHKRAWDWIDNISTLTISKAQPEDWAYNGEQIRLYPIPDGVYSISVAADPRLTRPAANTDAGVWMNDAEALIRTRAKLYLLVNVIRASDMEAEVTALKMQEIEERNALFSETASRESTGQLEPVRF